MEKAIICFNECESFLQENDYYEVSMVHRLAFYLNEIIKNDARFEDMYIDIEYNRGADGNTYVAKYLIDDSDEKHEVRLDLAITSRSHDEGYGFHNLVCAEIKKIKC